MPSLLSKNTKPRVLLAALCLVVLATGLGVAMSHRPETRAKAHFSVPELTIHELGQYPLGKGYILRIFTDKSGLLNLQYNLVEVSSTTFGVPGIFPDKSNWFAYVETSGNIWVADDSQVVLFENDANSQYLATHVSVRSLISPSDSEHRGGFSNSVYQRTPKVVLENLDPKLTARIQEFLKAEPTAKDPAYSPEHSAKNPETEAPPTTRT